MHWERLVILSGFRCRETTDFPSPFLLSSFPTPFFERIISGIKNVHRIFHIYVRIYTSRCKLEVEAKGIYDSKIITNISRRIWFPKTLKILFQIYYNNPFCSNVARNAPPQPFERTFDSLMNFCRGPLSASVWPRSRYANSLSYPRGRAQLEIRGTNARNDVPPSLLLLHSPIAVVYRKVAFR